MTRRIYAYCNSCVYWKLCRMLKIGSSGNRYPFCVKCERLLKS